jgi:hypothetical protein
VVPKQPSNGEEKGERPARDKGTAGGGAKGKRQGTGTKATGKGKGHDKKATRPGSKSKGKRRGSKATEEARERAARLLDPGLAVVADDPLRAEIVDIALRRLYSPSEYARESGCTLGAASYHFKVLKDHDFLELVEVVPVRGTRKHMYRATKRAYLGANDWAKVPKSLQPGLAGLALRGFDARAIEAMEAGTFYKRDDPYLIWRAGVLNELTWPKFVAMMDWAYREAEEYEVESVEQLASGEATECIPITFAIAGFESPRESERKATAKKPKAQGKKGKAKPMGSEGKSKAKASGRKVAPQGRAKGSSKATRNPRDSAKQNSSQSKASRSGRKGWRGK